MADYKYRLVPTPTKVDSDYLYKLMEFLKKHPNEDVAINFKNTAQFSLTDIRKIEGVSNGRVYIRVEGGYDQRRIDSYPKESHVRIHKYDNVYTISEIKRILAEIEKIERGINPNWSHEQKLMYFVGTLKNKIIYHPFFETAASKDIRSLRGLFSHQTVCAGYAMILKELCDRNGIECQYVEGCKTQEDIDKGWLTHAWNIVKINGQYFPLDLTWNAGRNSRGKTMSISDLANVNEFVKEHVPGKHEVIQDYKKTLKSIDGQYLTAMSNLVNKDMSYGLSTVYIKRKDFVLHISQVEEFVVDNKCVYKYVCFKQDKNTNGAPHIFYSTTNVLEIVRFCAKKKKLEGQLVEAKKNGWARKTKEIEEELKKYDSYPAADKVVDDLLFSDVNLSAAVRRGDNFLGRVGKSQDGLKHPDTVFVDPTFAKKVNKKQRTIKRSDGTSFVLEPMDCLNLGSKKVFRYRLFEYALEPNEHRLVMRKNTIFTDKDIMYDNRRELADVFLSRSRLDRKVLEAGGYLGELDKNNHRVYDPAVADFFKNGLYRAYQMKSNCVKDYVPGVTFDDMKRLVQVYSHEQINGKWMLVNKRTKQPVTDPILKEHIDFAFVWLSAAGTKWMGGEPVPGFYYAYEVEDSREIFEYISKLIVDSIHKSGNIDPVEILDKVSKEHGIYKYAENIVIKLFQNQRNIKILNSYFRHQNPSSLSEKVAIQPLFNDLMFDQLDDRRRELEEQKKQLLEVIERNGKVEVVPSRKR